jgi:hypothetical protein
MPECGSLLIKSLNALNAPNVPPRLIFTHTATLGAWLPNRYPARQNPQVLHGRLASYRAPATWLVSFSPWPR